MLCIYRHPPYPYSEELLWIRMTLVPLLTGKSPGIMNGTRNGHTVSLILICFTFCTLFSPSVVRSWQVLRLLFVWEAYWRNSSSEDPVIWMVPFFLVALAITVFIYYLMCNPLVRLSKYLLRKGMDTGGSASLSASYLPFLFLLILLFSAHVNVSLVSHSHFPEGRSVSHWPIWDAQKAKLSYQLSLRSPVSPVCHLQWVSFDSGGEAYSNGRWFG